MASRKVESSPNKLTVHKWYCETNIIYHLSNSVGICVSQLWSPLVWNLGLLISAGLYSSQRLRCVLQENYFSFIAHFESFTSQSCVALRSILTENNPLSKEYLDPSTSNQSLSRWWRQRKTILLLKRHKSMTASGTAGAKRFKEAFQRGVWKTAMWELTVYSYGLSSQQIEAWKKQR